MLDDESLLRNFLAHLWPRIPSKTKCIFLTPLQRSNLFYLERWQQFLELSVP